MRLFYLILLIVLISSCTKEVIKIKNSEVEKAYIKDPNIKTTKIETNGEVKKVIKEPKIEIINPKDGEVINGTTILVKLDVSNFKLVTPDRYPKYGQGHIQVWIDDMESRGSKTEFVFENVSNGTRIIKAELMMSNNTMLPYSKTIKVVVTQPKGSPAINIISPQEGGLIKSSRVIVELQAENFDLVPVGKPVKYGEGHFHVWLDSEKKIGPQTTFTFDSVVSGKHTIVAELLKSDHSSLSPRVTKIISINVESDYIPKVEQSKQEAGISEFTVEADDNGFYPNKIQAKVSDKVKINFKFRDGSIYFAGLDIKGPFPDIKYKLKGEQPITAEFTMKGETKITSYWPASGVKKADLVVYVEK